MKKIFTLIAATLLAGMVMAEVETQPSSVSKDIDIVGVSYTIAATSNAGAGNKCGTMTSGGVKFRANSDEKRIRFMVNEGYKITELVVVGNTNSNNAVNQIDSVTVDGVAYPGSASTLPGRNASTSDTISITGIEAMESIIIHFGTNAASQVNLQYSVVYETATLPTNVAKLRSISVDNEPIANFHADTYAYSVELPYGTTVVPQVTAAPSQSNIFVAVTQATAIPGTASILVTSADSTVTNTYLVNFTTAATPSTDAALKSLSIAGKAVSGFKADSLVYNYNVAYVDTVIPQVTAVVNDETASLVINQATAVPGVATVVVTAQAGNTLTYTINFIRLEAEKKIKELFLDNHFYAYQPDGNDTVFAHYIAGTPAPEILSYVISDGATILRNNDALTVTGADNTTKVYPFQVTAVTPYLAGTDTIIFDGTEDWVVAPYGYEPDSLESNGEMKAAKNGYKFAKTDNDYSREWAGKTHVSIYLAEADSICLIGGNTTNRNVNVFVNGELRQSGSVGKSANLWVPVQRKAAFCLSIESNQSSGDGAVKGIVVVHLAAEATGCENMLEENAVRKYMLNGQLVIEKNGEHFTVTGQRL